MLKLSCVCVCVCVCVCLCVCASRRRKTLIQNRGWRSLLASSGTSATLSMRRPYSPIVSDLPCHWVLSMFRWRHGTTGATSSHVKNLTAQTRQSTMTASHSSFIEVPSTGLQVCVPVLFTATIRISMNLFVRLDQNWGKYRHSPDEVPGSQIYGKLLIHWLC